VLPSCSWSIVSLSALLASSPLTFDLLLHHMLHFRAIWVCLFISTEFLGFCFIFNASSLLALPGAFGPNAGASIAADSPDTLYLIPPSFPLVLLIDLVV
jgi:hypothetical protein